MQCIHVYASDHAIQCHIGFHSKLFYLPAKSCDERLLAYAYDHAIQCHTGFCYKLFYFPTKFSNGRLFTAYADVAYGTIGFYDIK